MIRAQRWAVIALAALCSAVAADAACTLSPNTDHDFADLVKEHSPGFAACDATPENGTTAKIPQRRQWRLETPCPVMRSRSFSAHHRCQEAT
jgi:hypothetical protein